MQSGTERRAPGDSTNANLKKMEEDMALKDKGRQVQWLSDPGHLHLGYKDIVDTLPVTNRKFYESCRVHRRRPGHNLHTVRALRGILPAAQHIHDMFQLARETRLRDCQDTAE